jgi:ubiquinone biosynthesis protein COQ9
MYDVNLDPFFEEASEHLWEWSSILLRWPEAEERFPAGIQDLFGALGTVIDQRLETCDISDLRTSEKIETLVMKSLEMPTAYQKGLRLAVGIFLKQPSSFSWAVGLFYQRIDKIWRLAGDRSLNMSFYSKRLSLGAIYSATSLRWLYDTSPSYYQTHQILKLQLSLLSAMHR